MSKQLIDEYFQYTFGFTPVAEDGRRVAYDDPRMAAMLLTMLRDSDPKIESAFNEIFARVMDRILEGAPELPEGSVELPEKAAGNMRAARQARKAKSELFDKVRSNVRASLRGSLGL